MGAWANHRSTSRTTDRPGEAQRRHRGRGRTRLIGAAIVAVTLTATTAVVTLADAAPASADTVINGCTIVSNPTSTNFTNCPGANLSGANLSGVDLSFANLAGAAFASCVLQMQIPPIQCNNASLTGANLHDTNLSNAVFTACLVFSPANPPVYGVASADLSQANLSGADLSNASLRCFLDVGLGGFVDTTFTGANLAGANLTGTSLVPPGTAAAAPTSTGVAVAWSTPDSLPGATPGACTPASGSTFPLGNTSVTCQVLDDHGGVATGTFTVTVKLATTTTLSSSINPVVVGGQVTYTATVSPAQTGGTVTFQDRSGNPCVAVPVSGSTATCTATASATGADNVIATFSGTAAFAGSVDLRTEVVTQQPCQTLAGCDLSGLDLHVAQLPGANLQGANLTGANLLQATLSDANLTDANLTGAKLGAADLAGANLQGAGLTNAQLDSANLTGAVLTGADLTGTLLTPSNQTVTTTGTGTVVSWPTPQPLPGATPGDCTPASGSTFSLGSTTVTCQVTDDHGNTATGTFTVTVIPPPVVIPYGGLVDEAISDQLFIEVHLSQPLTQPVTVQWNTAFVSGASNVQAVPGTDYIAASGTATFAPGTTLTNVLITPIHHVLGMPYKLLVVSFHNPTNARMGGYYGLGFGFLVNSTG